MKFMNKKRIASLALAGVMTASMATPAMAADNQTVITAKYAKTTLEVVVPADTNATINPYGLPVTLEDATTVLSGQPITIPTPLMIENQSAVALKVGASITTTVESGMTLETTDADDYDTNTAKELYVEFQAFAAAGIDGASTIDPTKTNPAWAGLKDGDAALKVALDTAGAVTAAATGDDLVLREGKDGLSQDGGVAFVRLSGKVAKKAAWEETDKLVATITYSFEPNTYTKSAGTIAAVGGVDTVPSSGTKTLEVNLTSALPTGVTATSTTWTSADETKLTVAKDATTATKAIVTNVATSATPVDITVTIVGSDGITYTASIGLKAAA